MGMEINYHVAEIISSSQNGFDLWRLPMAGKAQRNSTRSEMCYPVCKTMRAENPDGTLLGNSMARTALQSNVRPSIVWIMGNDDSWLLC